MGAGGEFTRAGSLIALESEGGRESNTVAVGRWKDGLVALVFESKRKMQHLYAVESERFAVYHGSLLSIVLLYAN